MRRLVRFGITPDLTPNFAKRVILTNLLGLLFAVNMSISALGFFYFKLYPLAFFTLFFVLTELSWPVLNHFKRYNASRVGLLITSNLMGLAVSLMLPDTGYNHGFFVMAGLPILLFEPEEKSFIYLGLLLPLVLFPFSEWAQYVVPSAMGLTLNLNPGAATVIRYVIGSIYVLLIFLMFLFLARQNARAEAELASQREQAFSSAKFAALGEMAGGIAHEINNPLMSIGLSVEWLRRVLAKPQINREQAIEPLAIIEKVWRRMTQIVDAMRMFARNGDGDPFESVTAKSIIDDTLAFCFEKFKNHGVELITRMPDSEIELQCRPVHISQVLLNLLNNAFDAVEGTAEKKIWLELAHDEQSEAATIAVSDTGPGVPALLREKIFQPFFTTKPVGKGTGLGLSLSQKLARDHGGELWLDTSCEKTRFVLELPLRAVS